jgi:hypothetical protein
LLLDGIPKMIDAALARYTAAALLLYDDKNHHHSYQITPHHLPYPPTFEL